MNGFINVIKPPGMTSHDVVGYLRRLLANKAVGHLGTLDPGAAGVLPIAVGKATKCIALLPDKTKAYRAEIRLGMTSDTGDLFGNIEKINISHEPSIDEIRSALSRFEGKIVQIPPMASSIKVNGKALYKYFRKGEQVCVPSREITVYSIRIIRYCFPYLLVDMECSEGTYVRSICTELGNLLGCGALMSFLIRYRSGKFELKNGFTFERIAHYHHNAAAENFLITPFDALSDYPYFTVDSAALQKDLKNGNILHGKAKIGNLHELIRICDTERKLLGIGIVVSEDPPRIHPKKVFITEK